MSITVRDVAYTRLKTSDVPMAADFATRVLGLQSTERTTGQHAFRSDARAITLSYEDGNPADSVAGFELPDSDELDRAGAVLEEMGHAVRRGTRAECDQRHVRDFIEFRDAGGATMEFAVAPAISGRRMFPSRDAGVTGFSHVGLFSSNPARDEHFWTEVCNARVSDRVGELPLLRISQIHHSIALVPAPRSGLQHINHQVASIDDVQSNYAALKHYGVPIVFGPGRHPTSGARFVYFEGPDGLVFEYSVGVSEVEEETYRERQFGFEPSSFCMWGAKAEIKELQS